VPGLEAALEGFEFDMAALAETIARFFETHAIEAPGRAPDALAEAIVG
jgi:hypothetical protein